MNRVEAADKVTGRARYAAESAADGAAYVFPVQAEIASGVVTGVDVSAATAMPGVLAFLSCLDPPQLGSADDAELALFQAWAVSYRGQIVAAVIADTLENVRAAAAARLHPGAILATVWSAARRIADEQWANARPPTPARWAHG